MKITDSYRKTQNSDPSTAHRIKMSNMEHDSALLKKPAFPARNARPLLHSAGTAVAPRAKTSPEPGGMPAPARNPAEETQFKQRRNTPDDFEQYALTAGRNGWYPCLHSRRINFYLKTDEVWKYGVAGSGVFGRFKATFLIKNKVSCIVQYRGSFAQCLRQEQIRLFNYPNLPENLARPPARQLTRPPYNPIVPFADFFNR